jgi:hypothetical protein
MTGAQGVGLGVLQGTTESKTPVLVTSIMGKKTDKKGKPQ